MRKLLALDEGGVAFVSVEHSTPAAGGPAFNSHKIQFA